MVESGDWLVPRYQGQPFFDKPILTYWLMAAAFEVLGPSAGAARLVPAFAALGVILATAWLGLRLFGKRTALAGAAVLSTTLIFVAFGRTAMSDMLLTLWTTLAVAVAARLLWRADGKAPWGAQSQSDAQSPLVSDEPEGSSAVWVLALGVLLGLGFATKGPVAWVMAGIPIFFLWWWWRRLPLPVSLGALVPGMLVLLVVAGSWFVALYARLGSEPLAYFFLHENLERFAGEAYDVGRPFWYYPPAYLLTGLPWSLLLIPALLRIRRNDASSLLAVWIAVALVPLSLSRGKLDYYLLPLYPAMALLVGRWLSLVDWGRVDRAFARVALLLSAVGLGAVGALPERFDSAWLPSPLVCAVLVAVALGGALACLWAALRCTPGRVLGTLAAAAASIGVVLVTTFLPAFRGAQPNRALAEDVRRERSYRPDARVVACDDPARVERDVLFEARVAVERRCDLWNVAPAKEPFLFLLRPEERSSLERIPGFREVVHYRYLPAATLTLSGFLEPREPRLVVLAANFATADPAAELRRKKLRKQEFREEYEGQGVGQPNAPAKGQAQRKRQRRRGSSKR
jgi:4-amino-4-deoxy-L-arabinose transferase-like glycosyltransferase